MSQTIEQTLQQGVTAHREGKLQDAERLYRAILSSQPQHPDANHNLGVLAVSINKAGAALPLFKTALEANPKIEQFWLSYIDALIKEHQFEAAEQVINQAEKQGADREKLNLLEASLSSIKKEKDVHSPPQQQINMLLDHYQNGQLGEAEKLALSLTQEFPRHGFSWKVLGAVLGQTGRKSEALNASQTAVALSPQDAEVHSNLGIMLQEQGRLDEAVTSYKRAIVLMPDHAETHYNLGVTLKNQGKLEEAKTSYKRAIALKSDYVEAHYNLGVIFQELGGFEEAEACYTRAIALKPDYAEIHSNLGVTLQERGRLDEAVASYTKAIALMPDYAEAHSNLGNTLKELGRLDEAVASYTKAIALMPDHAKVHFNLGVALKKQGKSEKAIACYKKAIALRPDFDEAKHLLAALTGETRATAPKDYVERLFDNYADKFETSLVGNLEYKTPKLLAEIITKDNGFDLLGSIMDLGCGTGLFGVEIKQFCRRLEGIDLSEKMLAKAKEKNVYDKLIKQDILNYLSIASLDFDYFVATDVFVYIGDLSDLFRLIKSRNKTGGKLAFSLENCDGDGFFLEQTGRYSHSRKYIERLCKKFGYELCHFEVQKLRKEYTQYVSGGLYVLEF